MALPVRTLTRPAVLAGQANGQLDEAILVSIPGQEGGPTVRLVEPAARAWRALCAAALAEGHILKAVGPHDSFRPFSTQERIFRARYTTQVLQGRPTRIFEGQTFFQRPGTAAAAVPGTSNHGWGLAVDTGEESNPASGTESIDPDTVAWLVANEHRFGFSHELQSEPWHIRYFAGDDIPGEVLAFEQSGGADMPLNADDIEQIRNAVRATLDEGAGLGQLGWAGTSKTTLARVQELVNTVNDLARRVSTIESKLD